MDGHPILDMPLNQVMRSEIALPLQQVLQLYTVGNLLAAWQVPDYQPRITEIFDSPQQAQHAVGICATWLGAGYTVGNDPQLGTWWRNDELPKTKPS